MLSTNTVTQMLKSKILSVVDKMEFYFLSTQITLEYQRLTGCCNNLLFTNIYQKLQLPAALADLNHWKGVGLENFGHGFFSIAVAPNHYQTFGLSFNAFVTTQLNQPECVENHCEKDKFSKKRNNKRSWWNYLSQQKEKHS